jgi:flagellar assembly factor FliW
MTDTIKVNTTRFGEIEVAKDSEITIINGIIGFPNNTTYVLLEYNPPFSWLQSTENEDLAFVVVNAAEFGEGYQFPLPVGDRDLDLKEADDVAIVNLVSVRPDASMTTVNLKAPIIVNSSNMIGRQMVLDDPKYPIRMPLWSAEEASEATAKVEDEKK